MTSAELVHPESPTGLPKVQLIGTVAGVDACHLLTDQTRIVVGSALDCDLTILDPLVPRRAFKLVHAKEHSGPHYDCDSCWVLQSLSGARVYVNGDLVRRERLAFGDTVSLGCHHFVFGNGDSDLRDRKANVDVKDLCASLVGDVKAPAGFLYGCASWRDALRSRKAAVWGAALAILLVAIFFMFPPDEVMVSIQPPTEIVMLSDAMSPGSVRSLGKVERKSFDSPQQTPPTAEPEKLETQPTRELTAQPIASKETAPQAPAPPELAPVAADAGPNLAPLAVPNVSTEHVEMSRELARLTGSAPARRLSLTEAGLATAVPQLGQMHARESTRQMLVAAASTHYAEQVTQRHSFKPATTLDTGKAEILAGLQYMPSPVKFQEYRGTRIPIARVPEQLAALVVGSGQPGVQIDGEVSDAEAAASFKTGRFRVHGPGNPPEANPATFCFVSKSQVSGKDHLYIGFTCMDPNLDALVLKEPGGTPGVAWDDSIEVFIDINGDRNDYHHILVNARGNYYAGYCPNGDAGINGQGSPWNAGLTVKTTINKAAGRWSCEILVPYDHFPQIPPKDTQIPFNVCRNFRGQRGGQPLQNWFSVYEGTQTNYHHPRLFGKLVWP